MTTLIFDIIEFRFAEEIHKTGYLSVREMLKICSVPKLFNLQMQSEPFEKQLNLSDELAKQR